MGWAHEKFKPPTSMHCHPSTYQVTHTHLHSQTLSYTPHTESKTLFLGRVELSLTHRAGEDETQGVGHSAIFVHILVAVNHEPTPVKMKSNSELQPEAQNQSQLPKSTTLKSGMGLRT